MNRRQDLDRLKAIAAAASCVALAVIVIALSFLI